MRKSLKILVLLFISGALLTACSTKESDVAPAPETAAESAPVPAEAAPTPETPGDSEPLDAAALMEVWKAVPKADRDSMDVSTAVHIINQLAALGEDKLNPILDRLADPEVSANEKALIVVGMSQMVRPSMADRLLEITTPGHDTTARACATHLYGLIDGPEVEGNLKRLSADDEHRVRTAALVVRRLRGDAAAVGEMKALFLSADTTAEDRNHFILTYPDVFVSDSIEIFNAAIQDPELTQEAQTRVLSWLQQAGNEASLEAIESAVDAGAVGTELLDLARTSMEIIANRLEVSPVLQSEATP